MILKENPVDYIREKFGFEEDTTFTVVPQDIVFDEEFTRFIGNHTFSLKTTGLEYYPSVKGKGLASLKRKEKFDRYRIEVFYRLCSGDMVPKKIEKIAIKTISPSQWENHVFSERDGVDDQEILCRMHIADLLGVEEGEFFYLIDSEESEGVPKAPRYVGAVANDGVSIRPVKFYFDNSDDTFDLMCADWMTDENNNFSKEEKEKYWAAISRGYVSVCMKWDEDLGIILNPASLDFNSEDVEDMAEEEQGEEFLLDELAAQAEKEKKHSEKIRKQDERRKARKNKS